MFGNMLCFVTVVAPGAGCFFGALHFHPLLDTLKYGALEACAAAFREDSGTR
ncbi:hypothetical protein D3C80_1896030 [compost metagenome]